MNITRNANLSARKINDEMFIMNREDSSVHSLNRIGTFIWEAIEKELGYEEILTLLQETFEVSVSEAKVDLDGFLHKIADANLIAVQE